MKKFFLFLIFSSLFLLTLEKDNETLTSTTIKNETKIIDKNDTKLNITKGKEKENNQNKNQNKNNTSKKAKPKKNKPKPHSQSKNSSKNENNTSGENEIFSLNDLTFDMVLRGGNYYKWLVILYSETCGHCEHARREIRKIFPEYKNSTSIRFAEIEINRNHLTNMRFDIEGVPYIFMLQNESIYELDLYPNQKNLKKLIETDFKDVEDELKPFPKMVPFYHVGFVVLSNIVRAITNIINELLYDFGFDFEFTSMTLIIAFIGFCCSICFLEFFVCARFCPDKKQKKKRKKIKKKSEDKIREEERKKEEEKKREEEKRKKEEEEEDDEEEEEEDDDIEDKVEEEKKIMFLKKKNQMKMKKLLLMLQLKL